MREKNNNVAKISVIATHHFSADIRRENEKNEDTVDVVVADVAAIINNVN